MNWVRENKFLTGFFAVLLIGVGVLGYLLYSASGSFTEISDKYDHQAAELKRLQNLKPYPDEENLTKMRAQKEAFVAATSTLRQTLAAHVFPVAPLTQEKFQDNLRASVSKTVEKATAAGVKLPEKFYLGFETYQSSLPKPEAAAPLGRQLQAIEFLVNHLIDDKIGALTALVRSPLPQERAPSAGSAPAPAGRGGAVAPATEFVTKNPLLISFTSEQNRARKWLNEVASAKEQFYIIRAATIKNLVPKGPARLETAGEGSAAPASSPSAEPNASPSPGASSLKFIVGNESIEVAAKVEIVDFEPPATPAGK